jgi:hypothetical protein
MLLPTDRKLTFMCPNLAVYIGTPKHRVKMLE